MAKSNKINLVDILDLPLEQQIHQIFIGKGLRSTYGTSLNLIELAEEMVFVLDFVNGGEPEQLVALNTLPQITGEDGMPALDLVKYFGLDDYIIESVLSVK
jgi:hypothetical protein